MPETTARAEDRFRLLADNAPVMIWRSDTTMGCDFFNQPWLDFTGRDMEQELGDGWTQGVHPDDFDHCVDIYRSSFAARREFTMTYRLKRRDGAWRWLLDNGRPYDDDDGAFAGYFGSCIDVTGMIETRERLERALAEKDTLLRELQHRVRNNMQLVKSILSLQTDAARDESVRDALRRATGRVGAVALAQEGLLDGDDLTGIDLGDYLATLVRNAASLAERGDVAFETTAEPVRLPLERAVPLGLAVNELLTNAARHAFPAGRAGTVRLDLRRRADGTATVTVEDDGIGLPPGAAPSDARTLGLSLVRRLAQQARARVETAAGPGTRVTLLLEEP
ncbi:sensor histidine kinase [Arenibaculum sp.]|jgi:PAS domain S-box-containing protein|uniref:sensor histidine kinase n=1 Tax=Arenibaculum sp. TaxID=2865862 RepID=UPI002E0FFA11|nr:histidine kinase dimerization/phosphoacceptor domain -containing protein [Arenibaculum sp.]